MTSETVEVTVKGVRWKISHEGIGLPRWGPLVMRSAELMGEGQARDVIDLILRAATPKPEVEWNYDMAAAPEGRPLYLLGHPHEGVLVGWANHRTGGWGFYDKSSPNGCNGYSGSARRTIVAWAPIPIPATPKPEQTHTHDEVKQMMKEPATKIEPGIYATDSEEWHTAIVSVARYKDSCWGCLLSDHEIQYARIHDDLRAGKDGVNVTHRISDLPDARKAQPEMTQPASETRFKVGDRLQSPYESRACVVEQVIQTPDHPKYLVRYSTGDAYLIIGDAHQLVEPAPPSPSPAARKAAGEILRDVSVLVGDIPCNLCGPVDDIATIIQSAIDKQHAKERAVVEAAKRYVDSLKGTPEESESYSAMYRALDALTEQESSNE